MTFDATSAIQQNAAKYGIDLSNNYGGAAQPFTPVAPKPLSASSTTRTSFGARTAWSTNDPHTGPASYNINTKGSVADFSANPLSTPRPEN